MKPAQMEIISDNSTVMADERAQLSNDCLSVREILNCIGDKWSVLIIKQLGEGPIRFNELRRAINDISQKMLTSTLRNLERDGFVNRVVLPTTPPHVKYELTPLGEDLLVPVGQLAEWAISNRTMIEVARHRFDARQQQD